MSNIYDLNNPFLDYKDYIFSNDLKDFEVPYKIVGKFDREQMVERYKRLSNKPKNYLHVRLNKQLEDYK